MITGNDPDDTTNDTVLPRYRATRSKVENPSDFGVTYKPTVVANVVLRSRSFDQHLRRREWTTFPKIGARLSNSMHSYPCFTGR